MPLLECENKHLFNGDKYGRTCPRCGLVVAEGEKGKEKTPEELAEEMMLPEPEWVCGWLVCIKGVNRGRAYGIHDGKNFIGSGDKMDIQILGDPNINKNCHAIIVYEAKSRETVLLPGESTGMVYLQEKAVYAPTQLVAYNILELGDSRFVYAPLCSANFGWEDYRDK